VRFTPAASIPSRNGHLDVVDRARKLFDEVIVGCRPQRPEAAALHARGTARAPAETIGGLDRVRIAPLDGLLVKFAVDQQAIAVVRGLRAVSDLSSNSNGLMNRNWKGPWKTIFLMPKEEYTYLSSRIVKEIARLGGRHREVRAAQRGGGVQREAEAMKVHLRQIPAEGLHLEGEEECPIGEVAGQEVVCAGRCATRSTSVFRKIPSGPTVPSRTGGAAVRLSCLERFEHTNEVPGSRYIRSSPAPRWSISRRFVREDILLTCRHIRIAIATAAASAGPDLHNSATPRRKRFGSQTGARSISSTCKAEDQRRLPFPDFLLSTPLVWVSKTQSIEDAAAHAQASHRCMRRSLNKCTQCGSTVASHTACGSCGYTRSGPRSLRSTPRNEGRG
jgi:pantetheine-phosphate adenylyltransferase